MPLLKDKFASERRKAKVLNFSIAYGKTAHGLSKDWGVTLDEAKDTVARWYSDRPEVRCQPATRPGKTWPGFFQNHINTLSGLGGASVVTGVGGAGREVAGDAAEHGQRGWLCVHAAGAAPQPARCPQQGPGDKGARAACCHQHANPGFGSRRGHGGHAAHCHRPGAVRAGLEAAAAGAVSCRGWQLLQLLLTVAGIRAPERGCRPGPCLSMA